MASFLHFMSLFLVVFMSKNAIFVISRTTPGSSNCGSGWSLNPNTSYCYKYFYASDSIDFDTAEQNCQNAWPGGHLVWITNQQENAFVANLITNAPSGSGVYTLWMGAQRPCPKGIWHWSAQQNITYTNWRYSPPSNTTTWNCGILFGTVSSYPGQWDNEGCYWSKQAWVCKAPMSGATNPPPVIYQAGCDPGWCGHNNTCWKTFSNQVPWETAQTTCQQNKANLASIHSTDENTYALAMIDTLSWTSGNQYWIGLSLLNSPNGQFLWSDNSPFDFNNWVPGQPDHSNYFGVESCADMYSSATYIHTTWISEWNDDRCDTNRPFVCKKYAHGYTPPPYTAPPTILGNCPVGWRNFGSRCYKYHGLNDAVNWTSAQSQCSKEGTIRANLVSIRSVYEQMFVQSLLNVDKTNAWIGIFIQSKTAKWADESILQYTNWDPTFSVRSGVALMHASNGIGKWLQVNGTMASTLKLPYICVQNKNPSLPTVTPTPNNCPSNYKSYQGDACYQFITSPTNYQTAQSVCNGFGTNAHLTSINDNFELAYITAEAKAQGINSFWIGLNDQTTLEQFQWTDGWPVFMTNWGPNQPDTNATKRCVLMAINSTSQGSGWYTDSCQHFYPALCKYTTKTPPTVKVQGTCPKGWVAGSSMCYMVQKNLTVPFTEAHFTCEKTGTNLASFHNKAELNYLVRQASIQSSPLMFYIGLYKTQAGFTWTDGTQANFFNWAPGQPTNPGPERQIVTALDSKGLFYTVNNQMPLYFICEQPKTIAGSTVPTGMMPTTSPNCQGTGYRLQVFLEFFDNTAGGGLLSGPSVTHCDNFWFTGVDQCDIALKLCVEALPGWIDLGQVSSNKNNATFLQTGRYGGWNNPMMFTFNSIQWSGFQTKLIAEDVDTGGRQPIDTNLCSFPVSGNNKKGVVGCKHMRSNGYSTYFQVAFRSIPLCGPF